MKVESLGWFAAGALSVLVCTLVAMHLQGQVGRYQLVEGHYRVYGEKQFADAVSVFRIDTATGETSMFGVSIGGENEGWGWESFSNRPQGKRIPSTSLER